MTTDDAAARHVAVETQDRVATVTLKRPDAMNAISSVMARELGAAFRALAANRDVWVVVLAAAGRRAFSVGADLKERKRFSLDDFHANRVHMRAMFDGLRAVPQPTIASVFGFCLGGGFELALSSDLMVAADDAVFALPEATVGLLPAGGGTQLLARRAGPGRAKDLIFTGRRMNAAEAASAGLLARLVGRSELEAATADLARSICKASPVAVREAKADIDAALGVPLAAGIELENESWRVVVSSEDRAEGIAAFNDKRPPRWSNK